MISPAATAGTSACFFSVLLLRPFLWAVLKLTLTHTLLSFAPKINEIAQRLSQATQTLVQLLNLYPVLELFPLQLLYSEQQLTNVDCSTLLRPNWRTLCSMLLL